jgi:hypothetical protein
MEEAVRLARELEHPPSTAYALHHANLLDSWRLDAASVTSRSEELLRLADAHGYAIWRALALVFRGAAAVASGHADAGLADIEEGFVLYNELSTPPVFWPAVLTIRATAHGLAGQAERAVELLREADANVRGDDPLTAGVALAHGDVLLALPSPDLAPAEARFERSAAIAGARGARMIELEAVTRLATLRRGEDTRQRLRRLYDEFTEGFDTPQLAAARVILEETTWKDRRDLT